MKRGWTFFALSLAVLCLGFVSRLSWEAIRTPDAAEAQDTGTCPSPQLIDTFEGTGDQQSDTFDTTTDSFRITYEVDAANSSPGLEPSLFVDVIDTEGVPVANASQDGGGAGETFVNEPAGTYYLDISFVGGQGANYTITVEQCEGGDPSTNPGGGASPTPEPQASPAPVPDPQPQRPGDREKMLDSGGPKHGPVLPLPGGKCLPEYPIKRGGYCYN